MFVNLEPFRDYFAPLQVLYTLSTNRTIFASFAHAPRRGRLFKKYTHTESKKREIFRHIPYQKHIFFICSICCLLLCISLFADITKRPNYSVLRGNRGVITLSRSPYPNNYEQSWSIVPDDENTKQIVISFADFATEV
jgi:hypothetical protein